MNENWTEELLLLMMTKRGDRIRRVSDDKQPQNNKWTRTTDVELFKTMGIVPTVVPRKKT